MKYLSLFSGIGGFELGIQQAHEIFNLGRSASPPNTKNRRHKPLSYNSNGNGRRSNTSVPECIGFSEIDKYATQIYQKHFPTHKNYGDITKINERRLPAFDLICGGFPCQSFSIAGKRGGFEDTRGTLFFHIARITKHKRPRFIFLENVKGLLSHDGGRTFNTIIAVLDELGYDVQWQVLNSKNFGVPQNRERVFIVGHLRGTPRPEIFPFGNDGEAIDELPRHVANTLTRRYEGAQAVGTYIGESKLNAQEIKYVGSIGTPRKKTKGQEHLSRAHKQPSRVYSPDGIAPTLSSGETQGRYNIIQVNKPPHSNDRVYDETGLSPTLNTMQGGNRQPFIQQRPRGNNKGGKHEIAPTITGQAYKDNNHVNAIRRLTPLECERLQGFPDGWTEGISDSQRYKCLGNAVTVNVIEAIMRKLQTVDNHV